MSSATPLGERTTSLPGSRFASQSPLSCQQKGRTALQVSYVYPRIAQSRLAGGPSAPCARPPVALHAPWLLLVLWAYFFPPHALFAFRSFVRSPTAYFPPRRRQGFAHDRQFLGCSGCSRYAGFCALTRTFARGSDFAAAAGGAHASWMARTSVAARSDTCDRAATPTAAAPLRVRGALLGARQPLSSPLFSPCSRSAKREKQQHSLGSRSCCC